MKILKTYLLILMFVIAVLAKIMLNLYANDRKVKRLVQPKLQPKIIPIKSVTNLPDSAELNLSTIISKLIIIESNNNPNLVGDNGTAIGILQIRPICVKDINRLNNTRFTHKDALDSLKSCLMAKLYLQNGIDLYLKKHNKFPTIEQIVRMWNGGIYKGYVYSSTKNYYNKYKKI